MAWQVCWEILTMEVGGMVQAEVKLKAERGVSASELKKS